MVPLHHLGACQARDGVVVALLLFVVFELARARGPRAALAVEAFVHRAFLPAQAFL